MTVVFKDLNVLCLARRDFGKISSDMQLIKADFVYFKGSFFLTKRFVNKNELRLVDYEK